MIKKVCITGATGYIGSAVCNLLEDQGYNVVRVSRNELNGYSSVGSIDAGTDWSAALNGADCVVHLAARAHILNNKSLNPKDEFFKVNVEGTLNLARQTASAGVGRFVFISSIGVNGQGSGCQAFTEQDDPKPCEPYAVSKLEAEFGLLKIAKETGLDIVIIRPPLVYGKCAPGNFGDLLKLVNKNLPLPLGAIHNKRSFISIDNLVDFILISLEHPGAGGKTFLVSDDDDVSTTELLRSLIKANGKTPHLLPVNVSLLRFMAGLVWKTSVIDKLSCNLQIDISYAKNTLGWKPPLTFQEGIQRCFTDD